MNGIGVSPGISIGRAFIIQKQASRVSGIVLADNDSIIPEIEKFDTAVARSVAEIAVLKSRLKLPADDEAFNILETHVEFLTDPQLQEDIVFKIKNQKYNVNDALISVINHQVSVFQNMDDAYMKLRAADLQDIGSRLLKNLSGEGPQERYQFPPGTIIIAEDLTPSDTIAMDVKNIAGFATEVGGKTSHAAIIAKSKGIPAVAGCGTSLKTIQQNDVIILDGTTGEIHVNPDQVLIERFTEMQKEYLKNVSLLTRLRDIPAQTLDGHKILLTANISGAGDMPQVFHQGGEGIGLFRTELLFMDHKSFPTEEEQFIFYKTVAEQAKGTPVIVRTLDIGGDKQLPYFKFPEEQNPFLGYRAIRFCLDRKDLFIIQLKAILRANSFGNLKIMFPMISDVHELREAKLMVSQAANELAIQKAAYNPKIEIGIMIEIPSAALTADILAKEVDFFSIGTNDLCQYTLAVDRMNEKIKHLYDPFHPSILRLIKSVIEQGRKNDIHVGLCGEMASDPLATHVLLGFGLQEFSMSAVSIPAIKNIILNTTLSSAKEVSLKVLEMDNSHAIRTYLNGLIDLNN